MMEYRNRTTEEDEMAKQRLSEIKDVLKNSKTLKEQLKGVCVCYDGFVSAQEVKEDQKSLSLMKNFFLQIVNKSQGEIIKYKQAYEQQRERRKELESKLQKQEAITQQKLQAQNEKILELQKQIQQQLGQQKPQQNIIKRSQSQNGTKQVMTENNIEFQFKTQTSNHKASVPFLDLTKVIPNFSMKQQQEQLKQYKMLQLEQNCDETMSETGRSYQSKESHHPQKL